MSTEWIPTPRTDREKFINSDRPSQGYIVPASKCEELETELHCANQKLQAIRELVGDAAPDPTLTFRNQLKKILNS